MDRREFLKTAGISLAGLGLASKLNVLAQDAKFAGRPNIIFILTDDVGLSEISCCGGDHYKTPHIDELARTGVRFEYCYAMPLCGPSRCVSLTGRYPFRTGLIGNNSHDAVSPDDEIMMPTVMKTAGYKTALVGKWGQICFGPGEWGFEEYLSFTGSGRYWSSQKENYFVNGKEKKLTDKEYLPDLMHDFLVDFMSRNKENPFYVHYSMSHMHGPILRTPDSKGPESEYYSDNVTYMDNLVGKLTAELDRLKLREKTLIIFTGDNGTARFGLENSTLGGKKIHGQKASMLEGGSRVPLIANWIGTAPAGKVCQDLTDFSDFFPTFAELGTAKIPEGVTIDGHSFTAQIKGEKGEPREWVYVELNGKSYVRNSRYKLTNSGEMFDMKEAPFNEIPVPNDSTEPAIVAARKRLQEILDAHPAEPAEKEDKPRKKKKSLRKASGNQ